MASGAVFSLGCICFGSHFCNLVDELIVSKSI